MVNHSFCLFRGFDLKGGNFPEQKKPSLLEKQLHCEASDAGSFMNRTWNDKCRNHMVSYGRATRSRVMCHFLAVKRNPSPKYI